MKAPSSSFLGWLNLGKTGGLAAFLFFGMPENADTIKPYTTGKGKKHLPSGISDKPGIVFQAVSLRTSRIIMRCGVVFFFK